ncbi:MAG: ABC transporter permease subunit [Alphaproteobacteria bacterium]|nr:ABC transporter permease subunit [Alphaproteobacteria bacterium]
MLRFLLKESGRWALALLGALAIAVAVAAMARRGQRFDLALGRHVLAFLRLDFGTSALTGAEAAAEIAVRGPVTLRIVLLGSLIAALLGVPLGLLLGTGRLRRATAPLVQTVSSAPVFCAGLALAFAARRLGFAVQGEWGPLLLPALTVGLAGAAAIQATMRSAAASYHDAPFRAGLRRLGLPALEIERVHVVPQIFASLLRALGEIMLTLLSAAVVSEWVFGQHGIADLFVHSLALQDWNMAAPIVFVFAAATLTAGFVGRLCCRLVAGTEP